MKDGRLLILMCVAEHLREEFSGEEVSGMVADCLRT